MADELIERVAKIISRYSMAAPGDRVGVAVSGGADSVALLRVLHDLAAQLRIELAVLHVNHGWRGAESDGDEVFVRGLAASLGLPVFVKQCAAEPFAATLGNREAQARELRRAFFLHCTEEYRLSRIALGHTRSDQAETVLHRLVRGTGPTGLAAMRFATTDGFVRPLLTASRDVIREWAKSKGLKWREDSSNEDTGFTRNRLRQETLPALTRDYNPRLEAVLANTALLAQAEEDYFGTHIEQLYVEYARNSRLGVILQVSNVAGLHLALQRRLIRRVLSAVRSEELKGLDCEHVESILDLCSSTDGHDRVLIPGADVIRSFDFLLFAKPTRLNLEPRGYRVGLPLRECQELPFGAGEICISTVTPGQQLHGNFKKGRIYTATSVEEAQLDGCLLDQGALLVRNWEPGDRLHRPGHASAEKVKTLFQEHRVLLWERRHWPVLVCGGEIAWVKNFGVAAKFQSTGDRNTVWLVYRGATTQDPERI